MLSGRSDDMKRIEETGRLNDWCDDNINWLKQTFGAKNLVSAVLHLDEKTPHIHATVVPIVSGERRKARTEKPTEGKKKYKKKNSNAARLCVDDLMARDKLKDYQDSYAEAMAKYGLKRGIEGSEARHITTQQHYRDLHVQNENLKIEIKEKEHQQQEVYEKVRDLYDRKDEARDKFLDMDEHLRKKEKEFATIETQLQKAKQNYEPYQALEELNFIYELYPAVKKVLPIAEQCRKIGIAIDAIRKLLKGETFSFTGKLFSTEHNRHFEVSEAMIKIESTNKLCLIINGMNVLEWFRQKQKEFLNRIGVNQEPRRNSKMKL
jgi:hypothetical protein